jgi:hypothetical protein
MLGMSAGGKASVSEDCNETKSGFTMEHNESLMGKHEPAHLSQYNKQASS